MFHHSPKCIWVLAETQHYPNICHNLKGAVSELPFPWSCKDRLRCLSDAESWLCPLRRSKETLQRGRDITTEAVWSVDQRQALRWGL